MKTNTAPRPNAAILRKLLRPPVAPVRRVDAAKLARLAGCWPKADADQISRFIQETCEATHKLP
jgi:hypothetical protein